MENQGAKVKNRLATEIKHKSIRHKAAFIVYRRRSLRYKMDNWDYLKIEHTNMCEIINMVFSKDIVDIMISYAQTECWDKKKCCIRNCIYIHN